MDVPVQRAEVDGVPVVWVDTPGRLTAELVFGVGIADETFLTTGVTHLIEHLVMRQLGEIAHEANAGVGTHSTSFDVTSSPAVVVEHLRRLCTVIADLDVAPIALATGLSVLEIRLTRRLRRETGLVYEVGHDKTHLTDGTVCVALGMDAPDEQVPTIWAHVHEVLDELCTDGPSEADLQRDRDELRENRGDVAADACNRASDVAEEILFGTVPSVVDQERVLAGLDPHRVALALRAARDTMVVLLPSDVEPPALPVLPDCRVPPVTGRVFTRARFGSTVGRGGTLVVGEGGTTLTHDRALDPVTVRCADVVGVGVEQGPKGEGDELLVLHAGAGDRLLLRARDWRDGRAAVEMIRARLPAELFFPTPRKMRTFVPD